MFKVITKVYNWVKAVTFKAIKLSNTASLLVFAHFYVNSNVGFNSFFRCFHMSDGLTLHEAIIEKILYSGNKIYHSINMTSADRAQNKIEIEF